MIIDPRLMIVLLAVSIAMSYGFVDVSAQELDCPEKDQVYVAGERVCAFDKKDTKTSAGLVVNTDQDLYADGNDIIISGTVTPNANYVVSITILIRDPNNQIVRVIQSSHDTDGNFTETLKAAGPKFATSGTYTITTKYGVTHEDITTFEFGGGSGIVPPNKEVVPADEIDEPPPDVEPPPPKVVVPPPPVKLGIADFVEPGTDPQSYVDRYKNEETFKEWFDEHYSKYDSIYQAVGLPEPSKIIPPPPKIEPVEPECGPGTKADDDGICQLIKDDPEPTTPGGCLIATAAYDSELAPQVQLLREIRDNTLYSTESGNSFMTGFNQFYYTFSPAVADLERQSPIFKEIVKTAITPMISSLSIMKLADQGSEFEVLGYGLSVIALNLGMYIAAPVAGIVFTIKKYSKSSIVRV